MNASTVVHTCLLSIGAGLFAACATVAAAASDACTLVTKEEIARALGRPELGAAKPGSASGGTTDCRFPGLGRGDFRLTLGPPNAKEDFALRGRILAEEGKQFEVLRTLGDGAYYWDDNVQLFIAGRTLSMWVQRTPRTEASDKVRAALLELSNSALARLKAAG